MVARMVPTCVEDDAEVWAVPRALPHPRADGLLLLCRVSKERLLGNTRS